MEVEEARKGQQRAEDVVRGKGRTRSLDYSISAKIIVEMSPNAANNTSCN